MRINTNMNAMVALNQSTKNTALAGASMEKLSSGLRINKAGDDATGLAISEKMRSQIRGLDQAERNTQDGISVVQTAEGAMEEVGNIVQRMRELSVQSANETNSGEDRTKITEELTQLHEEIDRIASSTQFNGKDLLNGTNKIGEKTVNKFTQNNAATTIKDVKYDSAFDFSNLGELEITTAAGAGQDPGTITLSKGGAGYTIEAEGGIATDGKLKDGQKVTITDKNGLKLTFNKDTDQGAPGALKIGDVKAEQEDIKGNAVQLQVGANVGKSQQLTVSLNAVDTGSLGLTLEDITAMEVDGEEGTRAAKNMISNLDKALESINTGRAGLGAMQNRLETAQSNLSTTSENLTAAESRIRDVDVAKEMMNLSKLNLLNQASQAMMSQAKSQPEGVMQLLR